jgi:hypothetical protein
MKLLVFLIVAIVVVVRFRCRFHTLQPTPVPFEPATDAGVPRALRCAQVIFCFACVRHPRQFACVRHPLMP